MEKTFLSGLGALADLQERDRVLDLLRGQIAAIPKKTEALNAAFQSAAALFNEKTEALKKLRLRQKQLESDIKKAEADIGKHEGELNAVKSNDAYKALIKEIEQLKAKADTLATQALECLDQIDAQEAAVAELAKQHAGLELETKRQLAELASENAKLAARANELAEMRGTFTREIVPALLAKYEQLRPRRNGIAVAAVVIKNDVPLCSQCNMALTSQNISDLSKKRDLVFCESCQRILYHPTDLKQ